MKRGNLALGVMLLLLVSTSIRAQVDTSGVVRVNAGTSWGSGVYLGDRLVLTASHVLRGEPQNAAVYFPNGKGFSGRLVANDSQWDQAIIELNRVPEHPGVCLATENPSRGDVVYAAGYGGGNTVQVVKGQVGSFATSSPGLPTDWFELRGGAAQSGSSGGPIFNSRGEVIGCLWGARPQDRVTVAVVTGRTQRFLLPWNARLAAVKAQLAQCGPSGCAPSRQPSRGSRLIPSGGRPAYVEPDYTAPVPDSIAPVPMPVPSTTSPKPISPNINYDAIVDSVWEKMRDNADLFRGPPGRDGAVGLVGPAGPAGSVGPAGSAGPEGPVGPAGLEGPAGLAGRDAELTTEHLVAMTSAILQTLKSDASFLDSIRGPEGPPGSPGSIPDLSELVARVEALETGSADWANHQADWSHLVLVADIKADYWPRLSGELGKAQGYYHQLRHVEPPTDRSIGPLPVMIAYSTGKSVKNWVGLRSVSQALSMIARGDFDQFIFTTSD